MIRNKIVLLCLLICLHLLAGAQTPAPVKWLLQAPYMRGASFSLVVKDVQEGRTVYSYDTDRLQSPASVLKTVATATALEILGEDYRYPTTLEYDGILENGTLEGNLYIKGRLFAFRTGAEQVFVNLDSCFAESRHQAYNRIGHIGRKHFRHRRRLY